ncbi:FimV/HubP family polar landmark protein [Massilia pseudoviolaceinigra]|uniref:FimV/HubP family polar landmark protein n=1 Tax=Massilia pseudoviolaceinigra TaxID=3057165 RepID=UPI0027969BD3|nr:FimV/HubP family polar landmark protein [Massilia sp. CCM 9206]MDQ1923658.1 FimV/HubP family polar landmark protein [Massilia sp. CCM 9206]
MHLNTRSKLTSFALKTLTGAVASAVFLSTSAYAAGLGKLTVLSSLGQPLNAEIELTSVANDEASGLTAKLAPAEAFRQANIDFNPALLSLRFSVEQRGGRQFIKVTSSQPVNEPFVDMLLELNWGSSGRLVREYTFLLDPVEMRSTQTAQVSAPVDVLSQGNRNGAKAGAKAGAKTGPASAAKPPAETPAEPKAAEPKAAPSQEPQRAAGRGEGDSEYKVKRGDTLGKIAAQIKPADISLDMMLVALYRANPDAFAGNNMNRLKSGQILAVPEAASIKGSEGEARGVVVAHATDFNAYRNKLAGQVASGSADKEPEKTQSAAGKITAKVAERPTAANESKDQLKLSKATGATDAAGKTGALTPEDKIAKEKAMADATKRVKELEKNVGDLEKIMTVKSKTAAGATAPKTPITEVVSAKPPVAAPAATPAVVTPPPAAVPVPPPAAVTPPVTPPAATPPAVTPAPVVADAPVPAPAVVPAPPPVAKPAAPAPEPSFFDMLMENIVLVVAAIVALLAGLFGLSKWRERKQVERNPSEPSILGAPTDQAHSLFAETGGQSVDTNNSVFNSSFAPSASQLDTNEVDPVAEADVYIAYGRDAQAEEILKEALRTHPDRYPVRLKLLEIYAARKDQRAFESQASELYGMTKGQGDEWAQAAALGLSIDAMNPLYASAGSSAAAADSNQRVDLADQFDASAIDNGPHSALMDLDLDLSKDATATPVAPAPVAPAAKAAEEHTLDFDLGGMSFEPVPDTKPVVTPAAEVMDEHHLSFDTPAAAPVHVEPVKADTPDMDFDMDFNAPATSAPAPAASTVSLSKPQADDDFNLDGMNFDLPQSTTPGAVPSLANDDPFAADTKTAKANAAQDFDMHSLDLDLPAGSSADTTALPDFNDIGSASDMPAGELTAVQMEMETKLDLAIAYQEIGDKEGARELLDEVIKGGSASQVAKANEMRIKLA